jgi:DNA repair ATPase RecN
MSTTVSFSATRYENVEDNVASSKNELSAAAEPLHGSRRTLEVKLADNSCDVAKLLFLPDTNFKQICADL